ncbi:methyl-accepting chemotaxis protein [Oceanospirillum sediminis]|uniref:Methyl-accepting chemotaxis protein n=1 Tax=Oceanospirillum sediminis TaxID=2760088 RepID=A0A839IKL7_9GAMM|nr:methyl-accepting chemotaxis protein [Oceanospirillum sediminis]MBB1485082.1 methyl-accepting chemotaxis protein [Oceanospirillum sediminis]
MQIFFRQFRIRHRISFILLTFFSCMALLIFLILRQEKANLEQQKVSELKHLAQSVASLLDSYQQQVQAGELSSSEAYRQAREKVSRLRFGDNDYFWLMDLQGNYLMHPFNQELLGQNAVATRDIKGNAFLTTMSRDLQQSGESYTRYYWTRPGQSGHVPKMAYILAYEPWGWSIATGVYIDDLDEIFWHQAYSIILTSTGLMLVLILMVWALGRSITSPLNATLQAMKAISQGDGDLTSRLDVKGQDEISELTDAFNVFVNRIHQVIIKAGQASEAVSAAAEELSSITKESSRTIEHQARETDQVASAIHQMSATVHQVAQSAGEAAQAANRADQQAIEGKNQAQTAIGAIHSLTGHIRNSSDVIQQLRNDSENIGSVLDVIRSVAEQTNLLALNAAIEAARAGEHGRGFAVVADEVRSLAQRTQESTDEIQSMVETLQEAAQQVVVVMSTSLTFTEETEQKAQAAGCAMERIMEAVEAIRDMNDMIASAAEQQSIVAEEINRSVVSIVDISNGSATATEQVNQASQELAVQSDSLHGLVCQFRV